MDRTERLLDLVALLLDAQEPVTFATIRDYFPDYAGGTPEASERKFERDKAELADLGIPLRYDQADDEHAAGYGIDRDTYYLPELGLRPDEWAVLYAAGSAALESGAFPGQRDLSHALRKIAFARGEEPIPQFTDTLLFAGGTDPADPAFRERLETLWEAVKTRKRVAMKYRGFSQELTSREVEPYGIALRRGLWIVVGYCRLRKALRTFHVGRIVSLRMNTSKPKSPDYEVPADFKLQTHASEQPWEHRVHEPVVVVVRLDADLAPIGLRLFPHAKASADGTELTVTCRFSDALVRQVLAIGSRAEIVSPPEVRAHARSLLRQLLSGLESASAESA
jgi:proteasome accessory factor B